MLTRLPAVALALALCAFAMPPLAAPALAAGPQLDAAERSLLRELNRVRLAHGAGRVRACPPLARAADGHSRDMVSAGFFGHLASDGATFVERIAHHTRAGAVGENLAYVEGASSAALIVRMWLDSPGHRRVLLSRRYGRVGIAQRQGAGALVVTADFASPL